VTRKDPDLNLVYVSRRYLGSATTVLTSAASANKGSPSPLGAGADGDDARAHIGAATDGEDLSPFVTGADGDDALAHIGTGVDGEDLSPFVAGADGDDARAHIGTATDGEDLSPFVAGADGDDARAHIGAGANGEEPSALGAASGSWDRQPQGASGTKAVHAVSGSWPVQLPACTAFVTAPFNWLSDARPVQAAGAPPLYCKVGGIGQKYIYTHIHL